LNVSDGSIYGIERDFNSPLNTYINTKTRIKNLYLTGQNLIMHGILGVTVGAVVTCSEILGRAYLMKKIKAKSN
jgi:all-trans-retinol 13,14-reductase